ncbi:ABC transporter substrate-binding protein [Brackiella oedipodis]|uniref:ABC transporter substrate-binding protein n=1 Tax=Brackiella oedipodis TaxID=124225 RepID=UPI000490931F|nr:ABC transporter substrate-binding protein [Brackiella oedipodis]
MLLGSLLLALAPLAHAKPSQTLVYCTDNSPQGFDIAQLTTIPDADVAAQIFNGLVQFKKGSTQVEPALAERWQVSEDGRHYTFYLRHDVKFHDTSYFTPTRAFNADDVVATFERLSHTTDAFNQAYPAQFPYYATMGLNTLIKQVVKLDDYTVRFDLNYNYAAFLQTLAMSIAYIYSAEYMQYLLQHQQSSQINQQPIGTGPFKWQRYVKDSQLRLRAHEAYWDRNNMPKVNTLVMAFIPDASVRLQMLRANECQVISRPIPSDVKKLQDHPTIKVKSALGFNVGFIYYNNQHPPLNDARVRRALDMAIDRERILKSVYMGFAELVANPMPSTQWSFNKNIRNYPYDPEQARQLLKDAGYAQGFEMTLWSLPKSKSFFNGRLITEIIQADWAKIGVRARIQSYEWGEYVKRAQAGEHDAVMLEWIGDNGDPDNWLGNLFSCPSVNRKSYTRFCHPEFQRLIDRARRSTNKAERTQLYEQAQVIWHREIPATPLGTSRVNIPMRKTVHGFEISPFNVMHFAGVWLE